MKKIIALILVIAIVLSACANTNVNNKSRYRWVYSGEVTTLNYLVTTLANEFALLANLVDTLIDYDKYGIAKPALATEWNISDANLVWTFKLREGVKWYTHDLEEYGEVTAQDFVDAMEYILNPSNRSLSANIAYSVLKNAEAYYNREISDFEEVGVKAKDRYTLEYTLKEPVPYFLSMLTYVCFFPVNGEFLDEMGEDFGTDNTKILYNGAYVLEIFDPHYRRVLVKNENYWDRDNVFIERLEATYNSEAETLGPELFIRGEVDAANIPPAIVNEWMKNPEREKLIRPNRSLFYSYFYAFNFDPLFPEEYEPDNWRLAVNNLNFRKAIFHGLDKKAAMLTQEPYNPEKRLHNTITPKDFVVNKDGKDYTQLASLGEIADVDTFNKEKALKYKNKAKEELAGLVSFPVKVLMPYNTGVSHWANRAQVIEQQLENLLGKDFIDIIIEAKPPTGFLQDVRRAGQFALLECNWGPDYADPETYTDPFIPSGTFNKPHLAEAYKESNGKTKYENMIIEAKSELIDIDRRLNLFAEAEAFLINEALVIPYGLGGGGYSASRLNPFESAYSPFGVSAERYKGHYLLEKPIDTDTFNELMEIWKIKRAEAFRRNNN